MTCTSYEAGGEARDTACTPATIFMEWDGLRSLLDMASVHELLHWRYALRTLICGGMPLAKVLIGMTLNRQWHQLHF